MRSLPSMASTYQPLPEKPVATMGEAGVDALPAVALVSFCANSVTGSGEGVVVEVFAALSWTSELGDVATGTASVEDGTAELEFSVGVVVDPTVERVPSPPLAVPAVTAGTAAPPANNDCREVLKAVTCCAFRLGDVTVCVASVEDDTTGVAFVEGVVVDATTMCASSPSLAMLGITV